MTSLKIDPLCRRVARRGLPSTFSNPFIPKSLIVMLRNKFGIYYYARPSTIEGKKGCLYLRIKSNGETMVLSIPSLETLSRGL